MFHSILSAAQLERMDFDDYVSEEVGHISRDDFEGEEIPCGDKIDPQLVSRGDRAFGGDPPLICQGSGTTPVPEKLP